jgi:hypothetical protein
MTTVGRRQFVQSLLASAPLAAISKMQGAGGATPASGTFNLRVSGPFLFLYTSSRILILSPQPAAHLGPYLWTEVSEIDLDLGSTYELKGPTPGSSKPVPTQIGATVAQRLAIRASRVGLDGTGVIDPKHLRYFALWVPMPNMIVPSHPVAIDLSGNDSPFRKTVNLPVGYTLIYNNVAFSDIKVNDLTAPSKNWVPNAVPLPNQPVLNMDLGMESSLTEDHCHQSAIAAFGKEVDLISGAAPNPLNLVIRYAEDVAACALFLKHPKQHGAIKPDMVTHPGHDCKAPILEIDGVSDSATVG